MNGLQNIFPTKKPVDSPQAESLTSSGAFASTSARVPTPTTGKHWLTKMNYRNRTACYVLGYAGFAAQLWSVGAPYPSLAWVFITVYYLLFPHILFVLARRSASPTESELRNLLFDSAAFGVSCALMGFPVWPTVMLAMCASINHVAFHGPSGALKGPIPMFVTGSVTAAVMGLDHIAQTNLLTNVFFTAALFLLFFVIAVGAQQRTNSLREARNELHASRTALESANERLKRQIEANNRFFAYAGHDLRQPLQAMQMFSTVLMRSTLPEASRDVASQLDKSIRSLAGLLDSLLDISRLESGTVRPKCVEQDLYQLLQDLLDEVTPMAKAKGIRLRLWTPANELTVLTDPALLGTVLRNLMVNAIKYTPQGGHVLLAARLRGQHAQIGVLDSGIGIAKEQLPRVFDDFFQVANDERNSGKGLGLGLSIVRRISVLLALDVQCRSTLGKGSAFWVTVPVARDEGVDTRTELGAMVSRDLADGPKLAGVEVVLVEDTDEVAMSLAAWLDTTGARVRRFRTPAEALGAEPPLNADALYLCDQRMPGEMSGLQFLNHLCGMLGVRVRGMLLTGETSEAFILEAQQSAWPVAFKPFTPERLSAEIEILLGRSMTSPKWVK